MPDALFGSELQVIDFAGLDLSGNGSGTYKGVFAVEFDIASQFPLEVVEAEAEGSWPQYVRGDPQSKVIPVLIHLQSSSNTQAMIDTLKATFSPSADINYLRVLDANGNVRRMRCKSLGLVPYRGDDQYNYVASLEAPEPVWEADTASVIFYNVSGSAIVVSKSWEVTNAGNEECQPVITITPYANRSGVGSDYMRPLVIAWRSSLEGVDSQGLPYPINVTDGLWNTSGLADYTDAGVRLWLDGAEINRYIVGGGSSTTSVWAAIPFQPARSGVLAFTITAGATSLEVVDPDDLAEFPDVGFLLVDTECIAYQGKTANTFTNLRRGQRGTTAASHTAAATVRWVEHDIRLSWGAYSQTFAPGLSSADEKPIIDLTASTNLRHKYGTTDGLIEPESLRPGQWLRELRAPSSGRRAQYASLGQTAGVVEFIDQLPEAGSPNFDSLSLYTPCFVSSNVTGVALTTTVGHHMMLSMYGVDVGGFESLIHSRTVCGWLDGYDTNDDVQYFDGTAGSASIVVRPDSDLARLTLEGRTNILTGLDPLDGNGGSIAANVSGSAAQTYNIRNLSQMVEVTFSDFAFVYASTLVVKVGVFNGSPDDGDNLVYQFTILNADLTGVTTVRLYSAALLTSMKVSGPVVTVWAAAGASGSVLIASAAPRNPGGLYYRQSGGLSGAWVAINQVEIAACINGDGAESQDDASFDTGRSVSAQNVTVHFNPAYTPLIVMGAQAACYTLNEELLTNTDTGESIILTGILPIDAVQTHDIAKMDTGARMATLVRDLYTDYEQAAGYFADPSDIQAWIRLIPGVNHITMSALGGGPREAVKFMFRSRWT